jgi:hypothetical protein
MTPFRYMTQIQQSANSANASIAAGDKTHRLARLTGRRSGVFDTTRANRITARVG